MSQKINPTLLGTFIIGAFALLMLGIITFGSGQMFKRTESYVMYFEDSVSGLDKGAPVEFQGVKIGSVSEISAVFDRDTLSIRIPVIIEVEPDRFTQTRPAKASEKRMTGELIERGMRAQLKMKSFVTGKLIVAIGFHPDTEINLKGYKSKHPEIPTIPSAFAEIAEMFEKFNIDEVADSIIDIIEDINSFMESPDTQRFVEDLHSTIIDTRQLVRDMDRELTPLADNVDKAAIAATKTLKHAEATLSKIDKMLADDAPQINYHLKNSLRELEDSARSLRVLTDFLQTQPDAIIWGKDTR